MSATDRPDPASGALGRAAAWLFGYGPYTTQAESSAEAQDVARGYLLVCVFYIHAMIGVALYMGDNAWYSLIILKLLAPNVSAYFVLSGMAAPGLARKGLTPVLRHSLVLVLFAIASHIGGFLLILAGPGFPSVWEGAKALIKPLIYGVGYSSFVGWFFLALAAARIFAYAFLRSKPAFVLLVLAAAGLVGLSKLANLPDNIYEWRSWPTAALFFLIGMRFPQGARIPNWAAIAALLISTGIALINRDDFFRLGPCLACDMRFVAQASVGEYGSIFLYIPQQIAFAVFLIWGAQRSARMMIGRVGRYFGQASLPMLLLHGWVLLTIYPTMLNGMAPQEAPLIFVGLFTGAIAVHAVLYSMLARPLTWLQIQIFRLSHLGEVIGRKRNRPPRPA